MLCSLYNGNVHIWNFQTQTLLKTFEVTELPVRSRKQWIVTGADDLNIRVFNYNTMEKIKTFEAHSDHLRCVAVHPQLPYVLTCSDDMTIKMWDSDKNWECSRHLRGTPITSCSAAFRGSNAEASFLGQVVREWGW